MADQVTVDNGSGTDYTVSTDDAGASGHVQRVKLAYSADGSATHVQADADGVLVNLGANNDVTVTGTVTANLSATDNAVLDNIDANTDSLAVVGGGVQATALRVTLASDSTGVLSVDDNGSTLSVDDGGSSLTVDGTVAVSGTVTVDSELPAAAALADNASNPTAPAVGSFGMVWDGATWDRAPGTAADGALVNLGANNDVTVTGTVTANLAAGTNNIGDVDVLTMPATVTEDAASAGGETAVLVAGVRNDAAASRTSTDGDFGNIAIDSAGRVGVADLGGSISVDDNGSSLTVDGTVAVSSLPALAAGTNNIGDVDVASIAAGDNAIGRVKLTDGTDVADVLDLTNSNPLTVAIVDGSGSQITSFGGGTQYTEGDTDASVTGTAVMWEDSADTLRVASAAKPLPVAIISGAGSGGTAMTDDAAFTPATTSITPMGAMFDDTTPDSVDEGDGGVVRMSGNRNLYVTLRDAAGNERGLNVDANGAIAVTDGGSTVSVDDGGSSLTVDNAALSVVGGGVEASALRVTLASDSTGVLSVDDNGSTISVDDGGGALTVDGTVGVSGTVTVDSELPAAAALADNTANPTVPAVGSFGMVFDGSTWDRQTQPLTDTQLRASAVPVSLSSVPSHAVTNAGTFATQVDGAALTALQLIDDIVKTDDAAFTPATDEVAMAGFFADETSTDSVDEGDAGAARMTLDRKQIVVNQPHTAGGCSIFRSIDLDETEEEAKATAGCVYGYYIANLATSTRFVKFYNATAANVTVGTTTPVLTLPIPGNSTDDVGANMLGGVGITFDTAITVAATTGVADNDTGAPGANEVVINLFYK